MTAKWRRSIVAIMSTAAATVALASAAAAAPDIHQAPPPCGKYAERGYAYWRSCSPPYTDVKGYDNLNGWRCWLIAGFEIRELGIIDREFGLDYDSIHAAPC
ncbi:hypothetical protein [Kibdelosporangium aridum]|uniref:Uncharacterized protein n=1 Tax=Kibdelosporangium aridum TaxID=2030 RepID=A0A1W2FZN0_KIBAR|nr:hypothetical protein [Kibdelosporangium aridum]SMD27417.1 hypothetical protein SAMN05661093_11024 [Kibdelosporangium aridum]